MRAAVAIGVILALGCAGCGLRDPYAGGRRAPSESPGARQVLAAFALAWGDWNSGDLLARERRLISLAAAPYAQQLRDSTRQAVLENTRAGAVGSRAQLVSIQLSGTGDRRTGAAVLREHSVRGCRPHGAAVTTVYRAAL